MRRTTTKPKGDPGRPSKDSVPKACLVEHCPPPVSFGDINLHLGAKYKKTLMIGLVLTDAILNADW